MSRQTKDKVQEATFVIRDESNPRRSKKITFRCGNDHHITINCKGYGDMPSNRDGGSPALVEFYEGKLRIVVWGDINQEDPTDIISLENARESRRNKDTPAMVQRIREALVNSRDAAADDAFEGYHFEKDEGVTIADHDGWETDGTDRLIKRIYFHRVDADGAEEGGDSISGSFIVEFKKGTAVVKEAHANL